MLCKAPHMCRVSYNLLVGQTKRSVSFPVKDARADSAPQDFLLYGLSEALPSCYPAGIRVCNYLTVNLIIIFISVRRQIFYQHGTQISILAGAFHRDSGFRLFSSFSVKQQTAGFFIRYCYCKTGILPQLSDAWTLKNAFFNVMLNILVPLLHSVPILSAMFCFVL